MMRTPLSGSSFAASVPAAGILSRKRTVTMGAVLLTSAFLLPTMGTPAFATTACPTGSTNLGAGVCEVAFTADGTWTPPSGVTKLEALLVGAGGGSDGLYGAGGGDVRVVELGSTGAVTIVVGAGGTALGDGGSSSVAQGTIDEMAAGGEAPVSSSHGGSSGSGLLYSGDAGAGAGTRGSGTTGGAGIVVSSLTSTFFSTDSDCFGGGGAAFRNTGTVATCGGAYATDVIFNLWSGVPAVLVTVGSATIVPPTPHSGGGAGPNPVFASAPENFPYVLSDQDGADGTVVMRFAYTAPELATTGNSTLNSGLLASALAGAAGLVLLATARRKRSR